MGPMTRHEFLRALHEKLKPKVYLEIGVQYGSSLVLAEGAEMAVGVDPEPLISMSANQRPNQQIFTMTSDDFFEKRSFVLPPVDLAFIDGMHLVEYAFRDWLNVQKVMRSGGVIVFDDVLPYNSAIADRVQPPGDWTGDVWKLYYILQDQNPVLVDTFPTGAMVLLDVQPMPSLLDDWENISGHDGGYWTEDESVPGPILNRTKAVQPNEILEAMS